MIDPFGNVVDGASLSSTLDPGPLFATGDYSLLIEGRVDRSDLVTYELQLDLESNTPWDLSGEALIPGATKLAAIAAGETHSYQFTVVVMPALIPSIR